VSARPTDARAELVRHAVSAVVIGGSAGAIDGLRALFAALPAATAVPVLVVVHLPAQAAGGVADAFRDRTTLAVREAIDKESAAPGAVLFAPAGYHLLVERDGRLALSVDRPEHFSRPAIDPLFETASAAFAPRLLAILLSGASEDGAAGMAAVRRAGGLAWAESPLVAAVPVMPSAALRDAPGTRALTIAEMADALAALPTHAPRAGAEGAA
jgi:two-component system chemotaxis response regulator CheB